MAIGNGDNDDLWLPAEPWIIREGLERDAEKWSAEEWKRALAYFTACQRRLKMAHDRHTSRIRDLERNLYRIERLLTEDAREELRRYRDAPCQPATPPRNQESPRDPASPWQDLVAGVIAAAVIIVVFGKWLLTVAARLAGIE